MSSEFRILVASDGSRSARAAIAAALRFPWPQPSRARGVVALGDPSAGMLPSGLRAAAVRALHAHAEEVRRLLRSRWPDADVVELHEGPADAIFSERRRFGADVIGVGWRGHGHFRRLIAGSVSRKVVAGAGCPVLVARVPPRSVRRFVAGFDGSPQARRALEFLARLEFGPHVRPQVSLVNAITPLLAPSSARLPSATADSVRAQLARANRAQRASSLKAAQSAAAPFRRLGWRVSVRVHVGAALDGVLNAVEKGAADMLVLGASSRSRLQRALVGSVAAGAMDRSPVPVLIVP
jgi:nucleotide-binding universal stress UspA family protein